MIFLSLPIGTLALDPLSLPINYPGLGINLIRFGLSKALSSYLHRFHHRQGLSRHEMRKLANRRRRLFVDTIIMQHERIHALERRKQAQQGISQIFEKFRAKQNQENGPTRSVSTNSLDDWGRTRWCGGYQANDSSAHKTDSNSEIKNRSVILRSQMQAKKARQASWLKVLLESQNDSSSFRPNTNLWN